MEQNLGTYRVVGIGGMPETPREDLFYVLVFPFASSSGYLYYH
jgi:hypothetical protein